MKKIYYRKTTFIVISLLLLPFCGPEKLSQGPFKVRVVAPNENGKYENKQVTLKTLKNINEMKGDAIHLLGGTLNIDTSSITQEEAIKSHYILKDKVAIPTDYETLAYFTAYYHFETIYNFWIDHNFFSKEDFPPMKVFYEPFINTELKPLNKKFKKNAFFAQNLNIISLLKTDASEKMPYKLSLAVLAHEYGHKIMYDVWAEKDTNLYPTKRDAIKKDSGYNRSALDEGFADWCSYIVTKDPHGVYSTLGAHVEYRRLPNPYTLSTIAKDNENFYREGVLLPQSLYEIEQAGQDSIAITKVVFSALKSFRNIWINELSNGDKQFEFYHFINEVIKEADKKDKQSTETYCKSFYKRYDTSLQQTKIEATCQTLGAKVK